MPIIKRCFQFHSRHWHIIRNDSENSATANLSNWFPFRVRSEKREKDFKSNWFHLMEIYNSAGLIFWLLPTRHNCCNFTESIRYLKSSQILVFEVKTKFPQRFTTRISTIHFASVWTKKKDSGDKANKRSWILTWKIPPKKTFGEKLSTTSFCFILSTHFQHFWVEYFNCRQWN